VELAAHLLPWNDLGTLLAAGDQSYRYRPLMLLQVVPPEDVGHDTVIVPVIPGRLVKTLYLSAHSPRLNARLSEKPHGHGSLKRRVKR
jgi:hypothetical protein